MTDHTKQLNKQVTALLELIIAQQVHRHVSSSVSTNTELMTQVLDGALDSSLIHVLTADTQTAGRGQKGRSWQSPKGDVYLSLYYPVQHASQPLTQPVSGLLSLSVGYYLSQLQIIQFINQHLKTPVGVKWANDIGFYEFNSVPPPLREHSSCLASGRNSIPQHPSSGRLGGGDETLKSQAQIHFCKLAGILIEPVIHQGKTLGIIVGVGLNVANAPTLSTTLQEGMGYQSVCLDELLKQCDTSNSEFTEVGYPDLYPPIITAIVKGILRHQQISMPNQAQDLSTFLNEYKTVDVLKGRKIEITTDIGVNSINSTCHAQDNVMFGEAKGVDNQGCLLLEETTGNIERVFSGKIDVIK